MSHKSVVDQIKHYQRDIDNRPQDSARILRCIKVLYNLPVTVRHLEETGIGKSVNALRKYGGETSDAAKALVFKWKAMVAEEEACEAEEEDRTNISSKESNNRPSYNDQEKRLKEKDSGYSHGKEKRSRESDSDHHSSSDKRQKLNEINHDSKEKTSKDTSCKLNGHQKSNHDKYSHHKDDKRSHSYSTEKYSKSKERNSSYEKDKCMKEKENKDLKHHSSSSSKSSHSIKEPTKKKRHVNESEEESDGSVKRRRLKSPSPAPSDDCTDNEMNNGHRSSGSEVENKEESEAEEDEEPSDEDEDSEEEIMPNPYLDTFIKTEPESSEYEDDLLDDGGVDDIDSDNEKLSGSPPESDAESEEDKENSEGESEQEDDVQSSRLSAESDSNDETQRCEIASVKDHYKTNDVSHHKVKSSLKEIDRRHERHKSKEENHINSSSEEKHSVSHKYNSSGGGGSSSSNKSSSGSNHNNSSSSSSIRPKSSNNVSSSSSSQNSNHIKHREHSKNIPNEEKTSHSVKSKEGNHKSDSSKAKEYKHQKSDDKNDKHKNMSSSKLQSLSSSSARTTSLKQSSSNKDMKYKNDGVTSNRHSSDKKSSSSREDYTNKSKKEVDPVKADIIKKEIKKDRHGHSSNSSKEISSKKLSVDENASKSADNKPAKIKQEVKIKTEKFSDNEDGIDGGSGASFADALLGMTESVKKTKKKITSTSSRKTSSSPTVPIIKQEPLSPNDKKTKCSTSKLHSSKDSHEKVDHKPNLLLRTIKLEPLEMDISSTLPEITPNYHPLPHYSPPENAARRSKLVSEEEALSSIMSTKNQRTKVFSGNKVSYAGNVPSLYSLCSHVILENIDALEYTGGVPYDLLKPILERLTAPQLYNVENYNPYLICDTDAHWKYHCNRDFRGEQRKEMESWRELYERCFDEREQRLEKLKANIKVKTAQRNEPVRKTKLAYVDSFVKPPRNVAKQQAKYGTSSGTPASSKHEIVAKAVVGANSGPPTKTVVPPPPGPSRSHQSAAMLKKKKAPLMMKTLQILKGNRFKR